MTYTTDKSAAVQANASVTPVAGVIAAFKALSTDEQLGLLWAIYDNMGRSITPAAPGAARLQFAEGLLNRVKHMAPQAQLEFMRDLVNQVNTADTRAYGVLSSNTKLAFWYQLAELMRSGEVIAVPDYFRLSNQAAAVFGQLSKLDFNQQITILRQSVVGMGVDPLA